MPAGEARGGPLDVVVCDGFVGNVVLKFYESAGRVFVGFIKREAPDDPEAPRDGGASSRSSTTPPTAARRCSASRASPSSATAPRRRAAIKNAIRVAVQSVENHLSQDIGAEFARGEVRRVKRPIAELAGTGRYSPARVMTNDEFSKILDTSDQWIRERTGIRERHIATDQETNACMAKAAALQLLGDLRHDRRSTSTRSSYATASPDRLLPSAACDLQAILGAKNAAAFDVGAACAGFIYALNVAEGLIAAEQAQHVLVVAAERLTRIMDWTDRTTAVLFGDGAGATLVRPSDGTARHPLVLHEVGRHAGGAAVPAGRRRACIRPPRQLLKDHSYFIHMAGREVFKAAVLSMADACDQALRRAGLTGADVDLLIPHQANIRIIEATAKHAGMPMDKVYVNVDRYGNTSAASIAIALDEAVRTGRLTARHDGDAGRLRRRVHVGQHGREVVAGPTVWLCPGQGAQRVGMGQDLAERFPAARDTFIAIDDALGVALSRTMFDGPEDELTLTQNAQPAILAHTAAVYAVVGPDRWTTWSRPRATRWGSTRPTSRPGRSAPTDAARLVRRRGELMHKAGTERRGTMAAVLGLPTARRRGDLLRRVEPERRGRRRRTSTRPTRP